MSQPDAAIQDDSAAVESDRTEAWAEVGRSLAQAELERVGGVLAVAFRQVAGTVARDEELTERDVRRLYDLLEEAGMLVDEVATVVPGSRQPRVRELLTAEELQEVTGRTEAE